MSQNVMVEVCCDGSGCERYLREDHWVALPLAAMMRSKLRFHKWLTVKLDGKVSHFCPEHSGQPVPDEITATKARRRAIAWSGGR